NYSMPFKNYSSSVRTHWLSFHSKIHAGQNLESGLTLQKLMIPLLAIVLTCKYSPSFCKAEVTCSISSIVLTFRPFTSKIQFDCRSPVNGTSCHSTTYINASPYISHAFSLG